MSALFATVGLTLVHTQLVEEGTDIRSARDFPERMRHADSILPAMTEAEVDSGIANLRARRDAIEHVALSFLVYQAHDRPIPPGAGQATAKVDPRNRRSSRCVSFREDLLSRLVL